MRGRPSGTPILKHCEFAVKGSSSHVYDGVRPPLSSAFDRDSEAPIGGMAQD
jgi:hypothetical protein